jgi:hypothetical protein
VGQEIVELFSIVRHKGNLPRQNDCRQHVFPQTIEPWPECTNKRGFIFDKYPV